MSDRLKILFVFACLGCCFAGGYSAGIAEKTAEREAGAAEELRDCQVENEVLLSIAHTKNGQIEECHYICGIDPEE